MRPLKNLLAAAGILLAVASAGLQRHSPPILPDSAITPGDTLDVTKEDICIPGYSKIVRNVPQSVKEQAYKNYGITHRAKGEYEVDHLISLEIGGSNSLKTCGLNPSKPSPGMPTLKIRWRMNCTRKSVMVRLI